jgi:hypothetical protein
LNLHLIHNDKFFLPAFTAFENNYPNQNLYLCLTSINDKTVYTRDKNVLYVSLLTIQGVRKVKKFLKNHHIYNILVHNADNQKINFALDFKNKYNCRIYWIFFGADLYARLIEDNKYQAFDQITISKEHKIPIRKNVINLFQNLSYIYLFGKLPNNKFDHFCKNVDFFCFWNENDYNLLTSNYKTNAKYKNFLYFDLLPNVQTISKSTLKNKILINHSASAYGNHKTVLDRLFQLGCNDEIICPLSYGNENIKKEIEAHAQTLFGNKVRVLKDFMPKDAYFEILSQVKVAFFGHRRQEAGANIFAMLLFGAKVFLRNDNNMLAWLKKRGFICFSFENDFNSIEDLNPLDHKAIVLNQELYVKYFSKEVEIEIFKNLIENG